MLRYLKSSRKRRAVFRQLHHKNALIIFLQETHNTSNNNKCGVTNRVVHFFFAMAAHSNSKPRVEIEQQIQSNQKNTHPPVQINDLKLVCANIYTPHDSRFQIVFIGQVQNRLQQFSGENIIIGGDFNCPFAEDDKEENRDLFSKKNIVAEIKVLLFSLAVENVWRKLHPNDKQFTWRRPDKKKTKCILDYIFCDNHLYANVIFKSLLTVIIF